ncbi:hypothetical protein [Flavobacterium davisii]|uniref:Uncharacterized protein n=1 Tax=Flavobacterium columnare TaxID=996 RepID=A0A8G0KYL2_9FLAO|nr:hypothetical protein [Flavobacterium davisii]QYS89630.1 hypothetical protein JJC05_05040 [Flavobacterium davisii]
MKKSEQIIKSLVLPVLEKDNNFNQLNLNDDFWKAFTAAILLYENDAKPSFKVVYELQLNDPEKVIKKLTSIHTTFIKELAELHVLEGSDEAINILLTKNDKLFLEQVNYFKTVKGVITKLERERIKEELPKAYEKVTFEIPENDLEAAIKKTERENLKKKFKQWDEELTDFSHVAAATSLVTVSKKSTTSKVFSLTWVKYAVASCFVVAIGTWVYFSNSEIKQPDTDFVVTPKDNQKPLDSVKNLDKTDPIQEIVKDKSTSVAAKDTAVSVLSSQSALGYSDSNNKKGFKINYIDYSKKIEGLKEALKRDNNPEYIEEYKKLTGLNNKYIFDGISLSVYKKALNRKESILTTADGSLYFYDKSDFYKLQKTEIPLELEKVKDNKVREELEKIIFENE